MKTILITAYAVNPYKGSEEGTGWNLICQAANDNLVIAVTRKNNKEAIQKYIADNPAMKKLFVNMEFLHFDLPGWLIAWKKGPLLSAMYFYIWQFCVAFWLKRKKLPVDIAHSLNFHSNWTPSFLWILGKPFIWGPVGNHPLIPAQYIKQQYGTKAWIKDRALWTIKWCCWNLDPFVYLCRKKAVKVCCVNTQAAEKLKLPKDKIVFMPAVASEQPVHSTKSSQDQFTILSVGRFVPLKGFDLTIRAFSFFYKNLSVYDKPNVNLLIIGTGPEKKRMEEIIKQEKMEHAIQIKEWMPRTEVIEKFSQSAVYLFPSHEGAGMVVAEALSYGLPVVCLDNYGPGEYVHPDSSLKVPHGNYSNTVKELADKLRRLFSVKAIYIIERQLALERYQQLFRWEIKREQLNKIYNDCLQNTGKEIPFTKYSTPH